jgi:hypothetical protein
MDAVFTRFAWEKNEKGECLLIADSYNIHIVIVFIACLISLAMEYFFSIWKPRSVNCLSLA